MENKEVWVVVLVLGFVLLLNSNSFTGNALAPNTGDRAMLLRGVVPSRAVPLGLQTSPTGYQYIPREIIGGAQGSGENWYGTPRYNYYDQREIEVTSSPQTYGTPTPGLTPEAGRYAMQPRPDVIYPTGKVGYLTQGEGMITPPGYAPTVRSSR